MNLMKSFQDLAGSQLADLAGNYLGLSPEQSVGALTNGVTGLMASLVGTASTETGAESLMGFLSDNNYNGSMLDNLGDMFSSPEKTDSLMGMGSTAVSFLMGNKSNSVVDILAKSVGIGDSKMSSMMSLAAPVLMSFLGKQVTSQGLNASGLMGMLGSQEEYLKDAPTNLLDSMNLENITASIRATGAEAMDAVSGAVDHSTDAVKGAVGGTVAAASSAGNAAVDAGKSGMNKMMPLIMLVLAALAAMFVWKSCGDDVKSAANTTVEAGKNVVDKTGDAVKATGAAVGDAVDATGKAVGDAVDATGKAVSDMVKSIALPGGVTIDAGEGSAEYSLYEYLEKNEHDPNTRFTFDGVTFETSSAKLNPKSSVQLDNLVALLKAYPKTNIRVEGHTDNTGNVDGNKKLSQARAEAVKMYMQKKGIGGNRIEAVGFGAEKPLKDNSTEEGRAENRRVDFFVTAQ